MTNPTNKFLATPEAISQLLGRSPHRVAAAIERRGVEPAGTLEDHVLYDERALEQISAVLNKKPAKRKYLRTTPRNRNTK